VFTSGRRTFAVREAWNRSALSQYCRAWREGRGRTKPLPVIFSARDSTMVAREYRKPLTNASGLKV